MNIFGNSSKKPSPDKGPDTSTVEAVYRSMAVAEFSPSGEILFANDKYLKMVGYQAQDFIGRHHRTICERDYVDSSDYRDFWRNLANGTTMNGEYKRVKGDGETLWLEASYAPVIDANKNIIKILKIAHDVTQRVESENENRAKMEAVDRSSAVIRFDLKGNVVSANRNFLNAMGYTEEEIIGKHHRIFCDKSYADSDDYKKFWDQLRSGRYISSRFERIGKNGNVVWLEASYNPLLDNKGNLFGFIKYATDITEDIKKNQLETENAARAYHIAVETEKAAAHGTEVVQDAAKEMSEISEAVDKSATIIAELGKQSEQITSIVNTIRGIADQTNLLALNAAIEAARAGDQGRGFAVVADEVRQLAGRTSRSTQEISDMIGKIQAGTNSAITSMTACKSQASHGLDLAQQAGAVILQIRAGTKDAVDAVSIFAEVIESQK
ncbi:MAG: PAS domain-containing methyl-accepting chemotaxis protein [Thalassolituus sp.]|uniref:methyl-accepting chemotaxis protein n=1 Tax=Thalassolituus sp. TaxID=2030822 RepID=UPI003982B2B5